MHKKDVTLRLLKLARIFNLSVAYTLTCQLHCAPHTGGML